MPSDNKVGSSGEKGREGKSEEDEEGMESEQRQGRGNMRRKEVKKERHSTPLTESLTDKGRPARGRGRGSSAPSRDLVSTRGSAATSGIEAKASWRTSEYMI